MPSHRIQQINELIRNELNKVILKEAGLPPGYLATITKVKTSRDLSQSIITISILPTAKQGTILNLLNDQAKHLQYELGKNIILRKTPKLSFVIDEGQQKTTHIDELIDKIHQEG
ncbi:MAG: 30S ribosome-binding factor RbfA [bacterium]|nr:30S ribosome-binding factor RbfA [bacterium]